MPPMPGNASNVPEEEEKEADEVLKDEEVLKEDEDVIWDEELCEEEEVMDWDLKEEDMA